MRCLAFFVVVLVVATTVDARRRRPSRPRRPTSYRVRNSWSRKFVDRVKLLKSPLLEGPSPIRQRIPPPISMGYGGGGAPGAPGAMISSGPAPIRFNAPRRGNGEVKFGTGDAPQRLPPSIVVSTNMNTPPDAQVTNAGQKSTRELTLKERQEVAYDFVIRYNYTDPNGINNDLTSMITEMQHNYGIAETGELDDETVALMRAPRCGVPDKPAGFTTFQGQPKFRNFPVTYRINNYTPDLSPCQTRNIMKQALREWEKAAEITFREVTDASADVDMDIQFGYGEHGDGYPFDSANGLLAHAWAAGQDSIAGDAHFDESEFWTLGKGRVTETYHGNADGAACKFPFVFNNKEYHSCTTVDRGDGRHRGHEWCATTYNFDNDGLYGLCSSELLFTYGGNADGAPCVFPFTFLENSYDACTTEGRRDGYRWCATTSSYDDDGQWAFCPDRVSGTEGGNAEGAPCHFPFVFQGHTYSACTIQGRQDGLSWCATTANYDEDNKFGFCKSSGYSLLLVAAHEFGHTIGLDHSRHQSALMYPTYSYVDNFRLPTDDKNGAQTLYGPRRSKLPALRLEKCGGDGDDAHRVEPTKRTDVDEDGDKLDDDNGTTNDDNDDDGATSNDVCDLTSVDAMLLLDPEIFVFKGRHLWRMGRSKTTRQGPYLISEQWPGGPETVDAVYMRPKDRVILLFKGQRYWEFDGFQIRAGFPRPLSSLGFPSNILKVDAALNWYRSKNRKRTYFYAGNQFFRYNEIKERMDRNYPRDTVVWHASFTDPVFAAMEDPETRRTSIFFFLDRVVTLHNYKLTITKQESLNVFFKCVEQSSPAQPAPLMSRNSTPDEPSP